MSDAPEAEAVGPGTAPAWLRGARAAFVFFSRLPVGGFPYRSADWHWAAAHLPLVGLVVGAASAAAFALGHALGWPPLVTAAVVLGVSAWLTGALHEDGLADSADGLGGSHGDRERALAIMKDSRIGSYGALALGLGLLLRAGAIAALAPGAWFTLLYVHTWARVGPVWLLCWLPYVNARPDAKSQGLFDTRPRHVLAALGWGLALAATGVGMGWIGGRAALLGALAPLLGALACGRRFRALVGGVSGDLLGAAEQVGEVAAWLALSLALAR